MSIEIRNLVKYYGEQPAVNGISFSVGKGEVAGFLGPNGAGKSTTMKMITGFTQGQAGEVLVMGQQVSDSGKNIRKSIGYLPENNPLYTDLYVHEFLEFAGSLFGLKGKELRKRVKEMVERCGLTKEQNKKIEQLSRGYRQRVGLAQALIHDPEVLILDEPTSGLDPNQLVEVRELIREVSANKTVLFSTHIMQEVEAICDRVIVINSGKIVADDSLKNLLDGNRENFLIAEFNAPVPPDSFEDIDGILSVQPAGLHSWLIKTRIGTDPRPAIFKRVSDKQLPLISLRMEERSMEDVFRNLTNQSN